MCKYFEVMRFLHEKTSNWDTHSNVELEVHEVSNNSFDLPSPVQSQCHTPPPSGCASFSNEAKAVKRRRTTNNEPSDPFLDQVKIIDEKMIDYLGKVRKDEAGKTEKDEAELFCNSLIPVLREMDKKQLRLAKLKIEQLLYDLQYGDN